MFKSQWYALFHIFPPMYFYLSLHFNWNSFVNKSMNTSHIDIVEKIRKLKNINCLYHWDLNMRPWVWESHALPTGLWRMIRAGVPEQNTFRHMRACIFKYWENVHLFHILTKQLKKIRWNIWSSQYDHIIDATTCQNGNNNLRKITFCLRLRLEKFVFICVFFFSR